MISRKVIVIFFIRLLITYDLLAVTAPFTDDMESGTNGWTLSSGANDWERGEPIGGNVNNTFPTPPPLAHPSKPNCWATILGLNPGGGNYTKSRDSRLISPQIYLGLSPPKPFFSVYTWYKIAPQTSPPPGDYAYIEARPVGSPTWNTLESIGPGSDSSTVIGNINGWVKKAYDLSVYGYTGNIEVSFRLVTNSKNEDLGLYVDDVAVGLNYTTQDRYIIAIEPEPTPVSTAATTNNMTVRVEVRDIFKYKEVIPGPPTPTVWLDFNEDNNNNTASSPTSSSSPADISSGVATIYVKDTEGESVILTPNSNTAPLSSIPSSNKISATGEFRSSFRSAWEEKE